MKQLKIEPFTDRIIGLTLPENGEMYICDHNEVYLLRLENMEASITGADPYVFTEDHRTLGLSDDPPVKDLNDMHISYDFDPDEDEVEVTISSGNGIDVIRFETFSGDWFFASFSPCGEFCVIAEPYGFDIYEVDE